MHVYSVTWGVIWKRGILAMSLPSAVLWGGFSILLSLDVCSSGSCVRDRVQQHMLCFCLEVTIFNRWMNIQSSLLAVVLFLFFQLEIVQWWALKFQWGRWKGSRKLLDFTKLKSLLWQDSVLFSVLTLSREGKNVALIKEINCKQVLIWLILVFVYPFSCIC